MGRVAGNLRRQIEFDVPETRSTFYTYDDQIKSDLLPVKHKRRFYELQARDLIKQLREDKDLTYTELQRRLTAHGVVIENQVLINKINRGRYSFTFALQVLAAMDVLTLKVPNVLGVDRANPAHTCGWSSPKASQPSLPPEPAEGRDDDPEHLQ